MTDESSDVPRELMESIKDVIGRKIKISVKKKVKLELKGDRVENKVLVLTSCRAFLLSARIPTKLRSTSMVVETEKCTMSMKMASSEDVSDVLAHIGTCLRRIFPGLSPLPLRPPSPRPVPQSSPPSPAVITTITVIVTTTTTSASTTSTFIACRDRKEVVNLPELEQRIMKKVSMEPSERLASLQALWDSQTLAEPGPCVQWDVDTIYLTQDTRELNLQDFSHLEHRDLIPIIAALEYNQWFTKLSSKDLKLSTDVCEQILRVVSRSNRLEELVLENAGLRTDRGVSSLSIQFAKLPKGLKHLNLSKTSLSPKGQKSGVNSLCQSLSANPLTASTLTHLDLSGNALRGDDLSHMYNFLAQPNTIVHLDLSNTECSLEMVYGCPCHHCGLRVSSSEKCCEDNKHTVMDEKETLLLSETGPHTTACLGTHASLPASLVPGLQWKGKEVPPSFKQFFSSSLALVQINLSGTKLSPEPLKALLLGLACNHSLKGVSLDLSNCELRSGGAQVLEGCIAEIHNITSLDISDNGLESDLSTLIVWLSKNRSIQHLALGKNFNNMKSKNLTPVLDNLVQMIQDEDSPLQSLSLADSKLKAEVTIIINALGSNTSLTKVDISGNGMGDMGAKMLAKALQINTKLRTVIWDKNNITAQGFQDIAVAMENSQEHTPLSTQHLQVDSDISGNYTLRFMPIPMYDASQALKTSPEKTEEALQKIENYLLRNHETRKYLQEQAYRLQQGIVTSTTQQMIDRICVKVQDHLNSLRICGGDAIQEDLKAAERLMRDAKNSKTLLPNLYHVGGASWAGASGLSSSPIQETLESMAGEVTRVVDEQLKGLLESMVDAAENLCPSVMRKAHIRQDLIHASTEKISIPRTFVKNVLLEQSGIDILNKISEVKLTVASFLSDRIVDEILDSLSNSHRKLANHFNRISKSLPQREDLEVELVEEKPVKRAILTVEDLTEVERLEDLDTCMACVNQFIPLRNVEFEEALADYRHAKMTPKSKRKSIHSRMLRPVSRAFEMEFDLDKALEEVPIHIEDPPFPSIRQEKRSSGLISELPSEEGRRLEHFTKLRPKRNKKQQPTQAAVCSISIMPPDGEQNGLMGRVDEGVDEFFTKKVTKMDCKRSSTRFSDAHELAEGDEKKKRDSRRSGFLNLIKSRSRAERPPTVLMTEELSSPKGPIRSPPVDTTRKEIKAAEHNGAPERTEEMKTPEPLEEGPTEEAGRAERSESRGSPQSGRRYVQVMGSGMMAEMKAKQERRAASAQKKLGNDIISQDPSSPGVSSTERLDGGVAVPKLQPSLPEARFGLGTPEKNAKVEPRVDGGCRSRSSSSMPTSPKPLLQSPKPSPSARPSIPQKPRTASRPEDTPDSPSGPSSPKVALLPPILKKVSSDKERDGQSSSQSSPRTFSQEVQRGDYFKSQQMFSRRSWGPAQEYQEQKQRSTGKDGYQGSKSSDSGEEAEKEFIFV
ncbi:F-actin-uncapping protein LRRC16A [Apodemus speciosus]|uniref:F-actin-uncapping protein LRRC16A n=1 Tax=Apodemus speciosus TaxID=105296 RepID=A0ABQ0FFK3_APOSI